jgi:hypothetical protein
VSETLSDESASPTPLERWLGHAELAMATMFEGALFLVVVGVLCVPLLGVIEDGYAVLRDWRFFAIVAGGFFAVAMVLLSLWAMARAHERRGDVTAALQVVNGWGRVRRSLAAAVWAIRCMISVGLLAVLTFVPQLSPRSLYAAIALALVNLALAYSVCFFAAFTTAAAGLSTRTVRRWWARRGVLTVSLAAAAWLARRGS